MKQLHSLLLIFRSMLWTLVPSRRSGLDMTGKGLELVGSSIKSSSNVTPPRGPGNCALIALPRRRLVAGVGTTASGETTASGGGQAGTETSTPLWISTNPTTTLTILRASPVSAAACRHRSAVDDPPACFESGRSELQVYPSMKKSTPMMLVRSWASF